MANVFRKSSLEKLSNPDQLDRSITISSPMSWLWLIGVFLIIIVVLLWSIFGSLPTTLTVSGSIVSIDNSITIFSDDTGYLSEISVKPGDSIKKGEEIAILTTPSGEQKKVTSNEDGKISMLLVKQNDSVYVGSEIAKLTPDIDEEQVFVCYVPVTEVNTINKGMKASLYLMSSDSQKYGHMEAEIYNIGSYPANAENVALQVGANNGVSNSILANGPVVTVVCKLKRDSNTKSGFYWSNKNGKDKTLQSGTLLSAKIIVDESAPISKLLNNLKDKMKG